MKTKTLTPARVASLQAGPEADGLAWTHVMGGRNPTTSWNPSSDLIDAHALESEIERRGLAEEYAENLARAVVFWEADPEHKNQMRLHPEELFKIIHADPLSRVKAALLTVCGKEGE